MNNPIRHIAGPYEDGVQQCTRCLMIMFDYRDVRILGEGNLLGVPVGSVLYFEGCGWRQDIMYERMAVNCVPMEAGLLKKE